MDKALDRIEAALGRIEKAASGRIADAAPQAPAPDPELAARHERLRTAVSRSLAQLDALLGGEQR
ncbi:MAG: hypothetical protein WCY29_05260 [Novosphingobium sp.]